jgi:hypothetical protein
MLLRSLGRRERALLAAAAAVVLAYSIARGATLTSDFKNPYRVARIFWQTGILDIRGEPRYPPTIRVLLAPLAALPIGVAAAIWSVLSMAAIARVPDAIERLCGLALRQQALPWLAILPYVLDAFALGQAEPVNLFLVSAGLALARGARPIGGAGLIGLAGMIKVLPVVFWAVLVARRRVVAAIGGVLITAGASALLLGLFAGWGPGLGSVVEWVSVLHEQEGPWGLVATGNSLRENNEALPVVMARTFGDLDPQLTRNAVSISHVPLRMIWGLWLIILAAMLLTWLVCAWRARSAPPDEGWLGVFALTAIVMLMASPVVWPHYFLWLLPATLFLAPRARLLLTVAAIGQIGMMSAILRGMGVHTAIALALFVFVARAMLTPRAPVSLTRHG